MRNDTKRLTKDIKTQLQSINGQVAGLIKMFDQTKDPEEILIQCKMDWISHFLLLDETYRKVLAIKISETVEAWPGNCGNEDRIEFIRQQFPNLELDSLTSKMKEISDLKSRRDQSNGR